MAPPPGRRRTRATASLRRPVVWTSGLGIGSLLSTGLGVRQRERLWLLGGVRVGGPGVDLELLQLLAPERALGQHAPHRVAHGVGRLAGQQVGVGLTLQAAGVAAVADDILGVGLARGEDHLVGVDDDDVVTGVDVGSKDRLVLA